MISAAVGLCEAFSRNGDAPAAYAVRLPETEGRAPKGAQAVAWGPFEQPSEFIKLSAAQNNKLYFLFC